MPPDLRSVSPRRIWLWAVAGLTACVALLVGFLVLLTGPDPAADPATQARAARGLEAGAFDSRRAWRTLRAQVALGPRPAGSPAARRLARRVAARLPRGRLAPVPGGLANVVATVPGRRPAVLVGAHYDTKDEPGIVGANDGASGVAVVAELARSLASARRPAGAPELRFVLFDGEETPDDAADFYSTGLRGSRAYARRHAGELRAVYILDMVGDRRLSIPREAGSDPRLWARLRAAARRVGALSAFPARTRGEILDDHTPFARAGIPAADVIDFDYPCWHRPCDDLSKVSEASLELVGETMAELLLRWR